MTYFEIGVYHPKTEHNIGTLWRSAFQLGASGIFTIGARYRQQASDTCNTPRRIPLRAFETFDDFQVARPTGAILVAVEMGGVPLARFTHPHTIPVIYLLGAEDHGLPQQVLDKCQCIVSIESVNAESYNVAVAGSIIMYDRQFSRK